MWKVIALVWLVPLATVVVIIAGIVRGEPAFTQRAWLLFFDDAEQSRLPPWWWLKFGALLLLFFTAGLLQALIVINIGGLLLALPLITGIAAMFVAFHWLR